MYIFNTKTSSVPPTVILVIRTQVSILLQVFCTEIQTSNRVSSASYWQP